MLKVVDARGEGLTLFPGMHVRTNAEFFSNDPCAMPDHALNNDHNITICRYVDKLRVKVV